MKYIIKNTFMDRTKVLKHRTAPGLQSEPVVGGKKLKLRSQVVLDEVAMRGSAELLKKLEKAGVIEIVPMDAPPAPTKKVEVEVVDVSEDTITLEATIDVGPVPVHVDLSHVDLSESEPEAPEVVVEPAPEEAHTVAIDDLPTESLEIAPEPKPAKKKRKSPPKKKAKKDS